MGLVNFGRAVCLCACLIFAEDATFTNLRASGVTGHAYCVAFWWLAICDRVCHDSILVCVCLMCNSVVVSALCLCDNEVQSAP